MKKFINTFSHGINQDISTNKYPNTNFYWAQNFRFVSKDGLATGALTNVDGNNKILSLGNSEERVIGMCLIRDTLVIFVASTEGGKIFIWQHTDTDYETESPVLIYTDPNLNFSEDKPIRAVGRYENEKIQKIYFTDGSTFFKHLNIVHPTLGLGAMLDYDVDSLDLVSNVDFSTIDLEVETGGNLKAGKIQYAYQLYSKRGSETMFSPTSQLIHITEADHNRASIDYFGSEVGTIVNKSVNVTVNNVDALFTRIRIVALEYTVLNQDPSVRIVGEYSIENLNSITVSDTGQSIGEFTLEEFRFIQNNFYPKTIDVKDNYLFAANLTNEYFDITDEEFDARAFRANNSDRVYVKEGNNTLELVHSSGVFSNVPDFDHDCYNEFNDVSKDYNGTIAVTTDTRCKYVPGEPGILGGKGPNIKYIFTTNRILLDDTPRSNNFGEGYPKLSVNLSSEYDNQSNPLTNVGYQRDEIYRFGIVFFDKKGRQSFVKWIGDIRFPTNREMPYIYYDSTTRITYADILGIKFHVNIPESLQDKISGYRIVRTERRASDSTVIAQGLVGYPMYTSVVGDHYGGPYDNYLYSLVSNPTVNDMTYKHITAERRAQNFGSISRDSEVIKNSTDTKFDPRWLEFESPDVVINKTKLPTSEAFVEVFGYGSSVESFTLGGYTGYNGDGDLYLENLDIIAADKVRDFGFNSSTPTRIKSDVDNFRIYTPKNRGNSAGPGVDATNYTLEDGQIYNNQVFAPSYTSNTRPKFGMRGTHALLTLNNELPFNDVWKQTIGTVSYPIANYKVDRGTSAYGGSTYEARTYNTYYPASRFVSSDEITTILTSGDYTTKYLQLVWQGSVLYDLSTVYINTNKQIDFLIHNYGNSNVVISNIELIAPDPANWTLTVDSTPLTLTPDDSISVFASYSGGDYGYADIVITSDADDTEIRIKLRLDPSRSDTVPTGIAPQPAGSLDSSLTGGLDVFGGDVYISYFPFIRGIYDKGRGIGERVESYVFYPVESKINSELRLDRMQDYINWGLYADEGITDYKLMETTAEGVLSYGVNYPVEVGNLYRYNSAYSCIDKSVEYTAKPFDFENNLVDDVRITASEKKINGEYTDSWIKFKFNNYIDVDSKHNAITKILTFKNYLVYFQPTAVGVASVNPRSIIQDNQPGQLVLGTGGILDRYDYLTDKSGSEFYEGIIGTDNFMYYVDGRRKRVNKLVPGKEEAISIIKGIDSTLDKLEFNRVRAGFDRGYNEVIFSIDNTTVAFSELADAFISSYSFTPGYMISIGKDFYSTAPFDDISPWLYTNLEEERVGYSGDTDVDPDWDFILIGPGGTGEGLYKHNIGDPGVFYGGDGGPADSYITLIINPEGKNICYFDTIDLITESKINDVDQPDDIFYRMEVNNNYQEFNKELSFSSSINENVGTVKRIGRQWRTPIMPVVSSGSTSSRMVDTYIKLTLKYENKSNVFRVHDITTYYRTANH